ncbi:MAG: DnaA/Hda family protein, partial [Anaerolineales bacterium]|nr:DnaA/Hda family protein [Anaerolineales bacterium]
MENNSETTPDLDRARLEEAASKRLADKGHNPWDNRLAPNDRGQALDSLGKQIGPRYAASTLENFAIYDDRQRPILERLKRFADDMPRHLGDGTGLMMFGRAGTGKDHLMAALLKIAIVKHRLRVVWYDGGDLLDDIADAITGDHWRRFRDELRAPHILAISDPVPVRGEFTQSQLRRLRDTFDRRYRLGVSTWITTNLDRQEDAE